jgi:site-specific DNA recombinase
MKALRSAHTMVGRDAHGMPTMESIPDSPYDRQLVRLALLAPDLQAAILAGQQPPGLTLAQLLATPIPLLWSEQADAIGMRA